MGDFVTLNSETQFINHVLNLNYVDIPESVTAYTKLLIRDTIAVGIAGRGLHLSENVLKSALLWGAPLSNQKGSLLGRSQKLPFTAAAFVNGFQIHCQEYDCVHETAVVHPLATILSALLSAAEQESCQGNPVDGKTFIAAMIGAVNIATGLGLAVSSPLKFFRPATAGIFGATLGIAKIREYDFDMASNALGLALAHCSGTMQAHVEGKATLPIQIANAARGAVMACDLAASGLEGPSACLEGPYGYMPLYEDEWDLEPIVQSLGKVWRIQDVNFKVYPTGRAAQGGLLAIEIFNEQFASKPNYEVSNIDKIILSGPPIINRLVGRPYIENMGVNYARLCFAYLASVALINKGLGLTDFSQTQLNDCHFADLAKRISVTENDISDPAAFVPQKLEVYFKSGDTHVIEVNVMPGTTDLPFSSDDQLKKIKNCLKFGLGEVSELALSDFIGYVDRLDQKADSSNLLKLFP